MNYSDKRLWIQLLPLTKIQVTKVFKSGGEFKSLSLIFLDHEPSHTKRKTQTSPLCLYTPIEPRQWIWGNRFAFKATNEVI